MATMRYENKVYSDTSVPKTRINSILSGATFEPWDFKTIKGKKRIVQAIRSSGKRYLAAYPIPKKSILEDEDDLEYWMDTHVLALYPEYQKITRK